MLKLLSFSKKITFFLLFSLFFLTGCIKSAIEQAQLSAIQQYFEENFLDHNYTVHLATDNGVDLTPQYNGFTVIGICSPRTGISG